MKRTARATRAALAALVLGLWFTLPSGAADFEPLGRAPAAAPALRVYVVRHAQAWKNVPRTLRPPGLREQELDSLTERGHRRAEAIGRRLAGAGATRVLSSPAQRARQTAGAIARVLGIEPVEVSDAFEPLRHGESRQAADYRWRTGNWKAGRDPRPEGGESLADGLARAAGALDEIEASAPGTAVVVVTHGEITAALLSKAAGISPLSGYQRHFVDEGTISEIAIGPGGWELLALGVAP